MKRICSVLFLLAAVLLTGCLTLKETINVNKDRSVGVLYEFSYRERDEPTIRGVLQELQQRTGVNNAWNFLDKAAVMEYFKDPQKRWMLQMYQVKTRNGIKSVRVQVWVKDLAFLGESGLFGPVSCGEKSFTAVVPENFQVPKSSKIRQTCPDLKGSLTLVAPAELQQCDGKKIGKDRAVWEFDLEKSLPRSIKATW